MVSRNIPLLIALTLLFVCCKDDEAPVTPTVTAGTIKGLVSLSSGAPVAGANVYTLPPSASTTTEPAGTFTISGVTPGTYTVVATRNDSTGSRQVAVRAGEVTTCDVPITNANRPPGLPVISFPTDGSSIYSTAVRLSWSCSDPEGDSLLYDIYFDMSNPPGNLVVSGIRDTTITRTGLDTGRTYYWRVIAKDNHGAGTAGSIWRFTTRNTLNDSSLVLFLPFDGNASDVSRHGNHATVVGATLTSDRFGNAQAAYNFDGSGHHLVVPYNSSLRLSSQFTLCGWVYPVGFYTGRCQANQIFAKGMTYDDPGNYGLSYVDNLVFDDCDRFLPNDEHFAFGASFNGQVRSGLGDTARIPAGHWYFVVGTYDGARMRLYVNGTLRMSISVSDTLRTNTRDIWIGATENPSYPYLVNGKLDDIRIYRRALSDVEIQALYTEQ